MGKNITSRNNVQSMLRSILNESQPILYGTVWAQIMMFYYVLLPAFVIGDLHILLVNTRKHECKSVNIVVTGHKDLVKDYNSIESYKGQKNS